MFLIYNLNKNKKVDMKHVQKFESFDNKNPKNYQKINEEMDLSLINDFTQWLGQSAGSETGFNITNGGALSTVLATMGTIAALLYGQMKSYSKEILTNKEKRKKLFQAAASKEVVAKMSAAKTPEEKNRIATEVINKTIDISPEKAPVESPEKVTVESRRYGKRYSSRSRRVR